MDLLTYYSDLAVAYPEYITQKQFWTAKKVLV